jgi:flagellar assembly protein FliH
MSAEAVRWHAPAFDRPAPNTPKPPSLDEIEAIEAAARRDGHEAGRREGLAAGQAEIRRLAGQMEAVLAALARPFAKLDDDVVAALEQLAVRIAGELLGDAYSAEPARLAQLAQSALESLGPGQRDLLLQLNPEDARALTPYLPNWPELRITADPSLGRGDLRLHGEAVRIDARMESRLHAALAALRNPVTQAGA